MKLRNKLTLVFVLLTAMLQLLAFFLIFHFARQYTEKEFYLRLHQRATIAAQTFLEEDEMNIDIYEEIRNIHLQTLPGEKEVIYPFDMQDNPLDPKIERKLPEGFIEKIIRNEYAETKVGDTYYTGLFYHDNEGDFIVVLSARDLYGVGKLVNLRKILVICFFVSLIITWLLGRYLALHALSPISKIVHQVNAISATNLHLRLDEGKSNDEISELAVTFNNMLDRLETSFELQSNFVNNASHELRNPLTAILGQIEVALNKERPAASYISLLKGIESEALRLDTLVNGLLRLAQTDYDNKGLLVTPIRVDEVLVEIKKGINTANPENQIHLDFKDLPENECGLIVMGNRQLLEVAFHNILDNACKFSDNQEVKVRLLANADHLHILISDKGIGIPPNELKSIYEPFFRGSNARGIEGFGFGLPLAYRIVKMHHGQLRVTSQVGKGTIVKIIIPNQEKATKKS